MPDCVAWAAAMTAELPAYGVSVQPEQPHTNTFILYAAGEPDAVNERLLAFMNEHRIALTHPWWESREPGRIACELAVGESALDLDPKQVAAWIGELVCGPDEPPSA